MPPRRVLIIDDEPLQRWAVRQHLVEWGYAVEEADSAAAAIARYRATSPDAVLLDLRLGPESGLDILQQIRDEDPQAAVMMVTAHGDLDDAVSGFRMGLTDFFKKPIDFEALRIALRYRLETRQLRAELDRVRELDRAQHRIIGASPVMREALRILERVAVSGATTVLLQGESGTGKDLFAKELHRLSARRDGPFIAVNCAALPDHLLESELFGHEKGAFTDARSLKRGVFELADGGTLYLDEVGELKPSLQAKILRAIENLSFRRVGGTRDLQVDTRIIAASNRDLERAVSQGTFRPDLFYRLSTIQIRLPPLRERREDIPPLVEHFADQLGRRVLGRPGVVAPEAMQAFVRHDWPGNIRELRNTIERTLILEEGSRITARFLPARAAGDSTPQDLSTHAFPLPPAGVSLERVEESLVRQAIAMASGNQTRAARLLDISRDALRYKLKKFGIAETRAHEPGDDAPPAVATGTPDD